MSDMTSQDGLIDSRVINRLVRDIGADNTRLFVASLKDEFTLRIDAIHRALEQRSCEKLAAEAHALKGCALTYGAPLLADTLQQLEMLAKTGQEDAFVLVDQALQLAQETDTAFQAIVIES